jgi:uncharacterized membrane protein YjdF
MVGLETLRQTYVVTRVITDARRFHCALRRPGEELAFLTVCFCMVVSAVYELIEWVTALISAEAAESFLGTQSGMFYALIGTTFAVIVLQIPHYRSMAKLAGSGLSR